MPLLLLVEDEYEAALMMELVSADLHSPPEPLNPEEVMLGLMKLALEPPPLTW